MNWLNFTFYLAVCYGLYYAANIAYDLFLTNTHTPEKNVQEFVVQQEPPTRVSLSTVKNIHSDMPESYTHVLRNAPISSSCGVDLKELLSLIEKEVIEITKAIPY